METRVCVTVVRATGPLPAKRFFVSATSFLASAAAMAAGTESHRRSPVRRYLRSWTPPLPDGSAPPAPECDASRVPVRGGRAAHGHRRLLPFFGTCMSAIMLSGILADDRDRVLSGARVPGKFQAHVAFPQARPFWEANIGKVLFPHNLEGSLGRKPGTRVVAVKVVSHLPPHRRPSLLHKPRQGV